MNIAGGCLDTFTVNILYPFNEIVLFYLNANLKNGRKEN